MGVLITFGVMIVVLGVASVLILYFSKKKRTRVNTQASSKAKEPITTEVPVSGEVSMHSLITGFRVFIGIVASFFLIMTYTNVNNSIESAVKMGASAIQIIQVYSQGMFEALIITGGALALYILSRVSFKNKD
jgi:Na+/melibiose symporter-like transporter